MDSLKNKMDEIRSRAQVLLHYNNLLIKQCDSWLSEEEGRKNLEMKIAERQKKKKRIRRFTRFFIPPNEGFLG